MRKYHQLTSEERYALSTLRKQGFTQGAMARALGRHPSTISLLETVDRGVPWEQWSPEQVAGRFRRDGLLSISHETIYRYVWEDRRRGGTLHRHLRQSPKQRRKRYGSYDSRGRLAGRPISQRPAGAQNRSRASVQTAIIDGFPNESIGL